MKKKLIALVTLLIIALLVILTYWLTSSQSANTPNKQESAYELSCKNLASQIIDEYIKCDYNTTILTRAFDEWIQYANNYTETNAKEQYLALESTIAELRNSLKAPSEITLTDSEIETLRSNGLQANEFLFHNICSQEFYKEATKELDKYLIIAQEPDQTIVANSKLSHSITILSLESEYYNMLRSFSMLSDAIFDKDMKAKLAELTFQYSADVNLPTSEYERMVDATINKIEKTLSQMHKSVNTKAKNEAMLEDYYARYDRACEALDKAAVELEEFDNISVDSNDTKDMVADKIKRYTDIINRFETCANEYISSLIALEEFANSDVDSVNEEREALEKIIDSCNEVINQMKIAYENM